MAGFAIETSCEACVRTIGACLTNLQHRHVTTELVFAKRELDFRCFSDVKITRIGTSCLEQQLRRNTCCIQWST
jgi:copper chaperone CopZ